MRSSWFNKLFIIIGPKPPLSWLVVCLISVLALIALLSSSPSSSSAIDSATRNPASIVYSNYRRIKEQTAADYLELTSVSSAGGAKPRELGICGKERENFVPCHNVSANLLSGFKGGEEFDRHCEASRGLERCLVRPPKDYKIPLQWPIGRDVIWSGNVKLSKDQFLSSGSMTKRLMLLEENQIAFHSEDGLIFDGVKDYSRQLAEMIGLGSDADFLQAGVQTVLDINCGFGSFGAHLLSLKIMAVCIAAYEATGSQVQLALERGIPAMIGNFIARQLPYPSLSYGMVHCAKCGIIWDEKNGMFLIEVDRVLKPGGYFVLTSPTIRPQGSSSREKNRIMLNPMEELTQQLCWTLLAQQDETFIWQKTADVDCYSSRKQRGIQLCKGDDAHLYYHPIVPCISGTSSRRWIAIQNRSIGSELSPAELEIHGVQPEEFYEDMQFWRSAVNNYWSLLTPLIFSDHPKRPGDEDPMPPYNMIRNVMDMNANYGGLNAALLEEKKSVWVMNVVPARATNALPLILDRGFVGVMHDWCEPFPTYPRTYDMLHANGLISHLASESCNMLELFLEMDRILRPEGFVAGFECWCKWLHHPPRSEWNWGISALSLQRVGRGRPVFSAAVHLVCGEGMEMEFTKGNKGCDTMEGSQREEGCRPDEELDDACGGDSMNGVSDEYPSDYAYVFGLSEQDIIRKVFRSEERAYDFYSKFGRCHGFGVRKGDYGKDEEGNLIRRRFFCNRAGLRDEKHLNRLDRKRGHRPETRTNCLAKLSIYLDRENSTWKVRKVILDHNHELTPRRMVHMIPKFRRISDAAKANIDGMRGYGVSTSKILGYMAGVAGGYSLLGFTKKDAYNYIDHMRRAKVVNGDSNAAIVYLEGKAAADPMSMARYNVTKDGMLANMFWADGPCRVDYQYFGDVVAFDSTYKKNKYQRPLVIFSGSNNHKQTTIFGFGLVLDETIESYTWMLENLLEVMCNKQPSVVVTGGDDAMIAAVKKVFPEATHRLCAWHLQKNVTSNGGEQMFREIFCKWLYADMEVDDFELEWEEASEKFGLHKKCWANQMYEKRHMWCNAYLRGKFCAGYRTTSRCEGINSHIKGFLNSRHSILELVQNLELVVREYRNNELVAQFNSIYSTPVLTTCLDPIERCAADVYTRAIFVLVKKEIDGVGAVNFVSKRRVSTTMV